MPGTEQTGLLAIGRPVPQRVGLGSEFGQIGKTLSAEPRGYSLAASVKEGAAAHGARKSKEEEEWGLVCRIALSMTLEYANRSSFDNSVDGNRVCRCHPAKVVEAYSGAKGQVLFRAVETSRTLYLRRS
jgi:hypothetical protein